MKTGYDLRLKDYIKSSSMAHLAVGLHLDPCSLTRQKSDLLSPKPLYSTGSPTSQPDHLVNAVTPVSQNLPFLTFCTPQRCLCNSFIFFIRATSILIWHLLHFIFIQLFIALDLRCFFVLSPNAL